MNQKAMTQWLEQHLFSKSKTNVYTVLDGASVPDLPQVLWKLEPKHVCLYRGELEPDLAETAPYLVKLENQSPFTDWVFEEGWGNHWGIFVTTPAAIELKMLRKHFRMFLMVYDPDHKPIYFRYYDPRVLRLYLPTCNREETEIIFGPIDSYMLEDEDPSMLLQFSYDGETMNQEKIALSQ